MSATKPYKVLQAISFRGDRREIGEVVNATDEEAFNIGADCLEPVVAQAAEETETVVETEEAPLEETTTVETTETQTGSEAPVEEVKTEDAPVEDAPATDVVVEETTTVETTDVDSVDTETPAGDAATDVHLEGEFAPEGEETPVQ